MVPVVSGEMRKLADGGKLSALALCLRTYILVSVMFYSYFCTLFSLNFYGSHFVALIIVCFFFIPR